jgi:hypothetical protein
MGENYTGFVNIAKCAGTSFGIAGATNPKQGIWSVKIGAVEVVSDILSHLFLRPKEDISQLPVFNLHVLIKME